MNFFISGLTPLSIKQGNIYKSGYKFMIINRGNSVNYCGVIPRVTFWLTILGKVVFAHSKNVDHVSVVVHIDASFNLFCF